MAYADTINRAMDQVPGMTQRALAEVTGISQPTLNRILTGAREPKLNEVISIASALGVSVNDLAERSAVAGELVCSARSGRDGAADKMLAELTFYFELDAYLDAQGIARA